METCYTKLTTRDTKKKRKKCGYRIFLLIIFTSK